MRKFLTKCLIILCLSITSFLVIFCMAGCNWFDNKEIVLNIKTLRMSGEDVIVIYEDGSEKNLGKIDGITADVSCTTDTHSWQNVSKTLIKDAAISSCDKFKVNMSVCSNCGEVTLDSIVDVTEHSYTQLNYNLTEHWYECICGAKDNFENHKGGVATESAKAICEVCNQEYGNKLDHNYSNLKFNETQHWKECSCGEKSGIENHKGGTATCTQKAVCSVCGQSYGDFAAHEYDNLKFDENQHWYECDCGDKQTAENHRGGEATCEVGATCSICNKVYTKKMHKLNGRSIYENTVDTPYDLAIFRSLEKIGDINFIGNNIDISNTICGTICQAVFECDICNEDHPKVSLIYFKLNGGEPLHKITHESTDFYFTNQKLYKLDSSIELLINADVLVIANNQNIEAIKNATKEAPILVVSRSTDCCHELMVIRVYGKE